MRTVLMLALLLTLAVGAYALTQFRVPWGLIILAGCLVVNAAIRWWQFRTVERETSTILRVLHVWAEHWGEPPETVKPLLLEVLRK